MKRSRHLFLKGQENLRADQQQSLQQLLAQNEPLHKAYVLKEQFRQLYGLERQGDDTDSAFFQRGFQFLVGWRRRAEQSALRPFKTLVRQVKKRWQGILNYLIYPISNGLSEALNNKIASLQERAYGFRNFERFVLKIHQQGGLI